jgi:hypothetical protein
MTPRRYSRTGVIPPRPPSRVPLLPRHRTIRPAFRPGWDTIRDSMTVCIAATSPSLGAVVAVVDTMFSSDERSVESGPLKFEILRGRWICMFAGDLTAFRSVMQLMRDQLATSPLNVADIVNAAKSAYDECRKRRFECEVLHGCLMTHDEFMTSGLDQLGERVFAEKLYAMEHLGLGLHLLLTGFDDSKNSHIISVNDFGVSTLRDDLSFHAIGTGDFAALGSLHRNDDFRFEKDIVRVAHRLMEAKYCAETSGAVGKKAFIIGLLDNGECFFSVRDVQAVRDAWERHRRQEPERDVLEAIDNEIIMPSRLTGDASRPLLTWDSDAPQIEGLEQTKPSS